ncbi:MFS transporter [Pseudomonas sp. NPDC087358]|uniref:MFS transporter n=1 Tax=Pseudomonas sp. NPDC087358 TaxID=3364439 RepID=UPI00384BDF48
MTEHPITDRQRRMTLITCVLASSLAFIDSSVINVGLPAIGRAMQGDHQALQWLIGGYLLPLSALLLLGGTLGDRYGRRLILIIGTLLFALASVACGAALNLSTLLIARFLQGVGAALLVPNSLAILADTFQGEARGRAMGIWAAAGAATGAGGPILGGWLIDTVSWRMIFLINVPLACVAICLAWRYVRQTAVACGAPRQPLDSVGALLATLALAAITWGLILATGPEGLTPAGGAGLGVGVVLLLAFVYWERRKGEAAMMPLMMFGSATFSSLTAFTLLLYGALGCLMVLLPYVLIVAGGYSSTRAGAALLPLPLIIAVGSPWMGALAGRYGVRRFLLLGPCIVALGFVAMMRIGNQAVYWLDVFPALVGVALGLALAVSPLTTAVLSAVDRRYTGAASGLNNAIARTGGLMATAMLGQVLAYQGPSLITAFHWAAGIAALASVGAGACAVFIDKHCGAGTT